MLLTLGVSYEVFSRYILGHPTDWAFDASYILYGSLFYMAGAYALSRNGHVRGDVLYRLMPVRWQAGIDLVLYFVFFFPAVLALVYSGFDFAALAWRMNEHSVNSPHGPPLYPFKGLIPLGALLLLIQGVAETIRAILALRSGSWPQRLHDVEEMEKIILEHAQAAGVKQGAAR